MLACHPAADASSSSSSSALDAPQNGSKVFAMRHGMRVARLGRPADQRKALIRGLVTEVLRHGKIKTTKVRRGAVDMLGWGGGWPLAGGRTGGRAVPWQPPRAPPACTTPLRSLHHSPSCRVRSTDVLH